MKYITIVAAIFLSFGAVSAQDEPEGLTLTERVSTFMNNTYSSLSNAELPLLGTGTVLSTVECDDITRSESKCVLPGGLEGVNVCRVVAGAKVTMCAPFVLGNYVGAVRDTCGCCGAIDDNGQRTGQKCMNQESSCKCPCQDGRGILVKHDQA